MLQILALTKYKSHGCNWKFRVYIKCIVKLNNALRLKLNKNKILRYPVQHWLYKKSCPIFLLNAKYKMDSINWTYSMSNTPCLFWDNKLLNKIVQDFSDIQ